LTLKIFFILTTGSSTRAGRVRWGYVRSKFWTKWSLFRGFEVFLNVRIIDQGFNGFDPSWTEK